MPVIKSSGSAPNRKVPTTLTLSLPAKASEPSESLGDYTILLYGERKIGKTSLAARFPGAIFLMFEPGGKGLSIRQVSVPDWEHFLGYLELIEKDDLIETVVVDTADIAYDRCVQYVAKKKVFSHPNDLPYGEGWDAIRKEFTAGMDRLMNSGKGVIVTSHLEIAEFKSRTGEAYNKYVPSMPKAARKYFSGVTDIIAYYGYFGKNRLLTIQGDDSIEAGHRAERSFITSQGERVHSIPMGNSADEAYLNLLAAFSNKQLGTGEPKESPYISDQPAPKKHGRR
jgi:hypothetical protein